MPWEASSRGRLRIDQVLNASDIDLMLDLFAQASGGPTAVMWFGASGKTEYRPTPIRGWTSFCQLVRSHKGGAQRCQDCDVQMVRSAYEADEPAVYRCHAGLCDWAVPIVADGELVGGILGGQRRCTDVPPLENQAKRLKELAHDLKVPYWRLRISHAMVPKLSPEKRLGIITDLIQLARFLGSLVEKAAAARDLESMARRKDLAVATELIATLGLMSDKSKPEKVIDAVLEELVRGNETGFDGAALFAFDDTREQLRCRNAKGSLQRLKNLKTSSESTWVTFGTGSELPLPLRWDDENLRDLVHHSGERDPDSGGDADDPTLLGHVVLARVGGSDLPIGLLVVREKVSLAAPAAWEADLLSLPGIAASTIGAQMTSFQLVESLASAKKVAEEHLEDVVHEVNAPLAAMLAHAENMKLGILPVSLREYAMDDLISQAHRVHNIIESYRILRTGAPAEGFETVDISRLAEQTHHVFRSRAIRKGVTILVDAERGATARVLRWRLVQVLSNYLENAIKYADAESTVRVRVAVDGDHVLLSVYNKGPEIPKKDQGIIWDRDVRLDPEDSELRDFGGLFTGGTGIGLYVVRKVVEEEHRGKAWVESKLRETTFFARIPRREDTTMQRRF